MNQATIALYQRAASQPTKPSSELTYTFTTGILSGTLGSWTRAMPASDGNPCWVTTAVAISSETSDTILTTEWSTPIKLVKDGEKGETGDPGADAYTIILTNESHTFAGDTSAAIAASTTCNVIAYKGATRVAATIGTITGTPTGMSTSLTDNGTLSASFTVSVTSSMTTRNGTLTIPITVDGKSFSNTFSYALALTGNDAVIYSIHASASAIVRDTEGAISPTSITFNATSTVGNETATTYLGRFKIQTSADGST